MKESSRINIILTAITILGLLIVIALGANKFGTVNYFEHAGSFSGIFAAAALIFFAYLGFEEIVNVAEETRNPRKIVPRALIIAVVVTTILYVFTSLSAVSLAPWQELSSTSAPLAYAVSKSALGQNGQLAISVIALFATAGTVLGILIVTSRMIYGISHERSLPRILARLHKRTKTPFIAICVVGALAIAFLFYGNIRQVAEITSLGALTTFTAVNLAVIWLRYTRPEIRRPFKIPLNIGKYPILAFLGVYSTLFMIFQFEPSLISLTLIVLFAGSAVFVLRKKGYIGETIRKTSGIDIEKE